MPMNLPVELLETLPLYISDDFPCLAACSLTSSIFVTPCRRIRFHSITLRASTGTQCSHSLTSISDIIESSPFVAQYTRRVRILNPQFFAYNRAGQSSLSDGTDSSRILLEILSKLTNVTQALIWSDPNLCIGILWTDCSWIIRGISSLPSLQAVVTENYGDLITLSSSSFFPKIHGLALFSPSSNQPERSKIKFEPLQLSTFRLSASYGEANGFIDFHPGSFDFSKLKHLALGKPSSSAPFVSSILESFTQGTTVFLESLALEIEGSANAVMIPPSSLTSLQRIWIVLKVSYGSEFDAGWEAWLSALFLDCVQKFGLEVTFFLPTTNCREFERFVYLLHPALEGCQVNISFMDSDETAEDSIHPGQDVPDGWMCRSHKSQHTIWTEFYEL